MAGRCCQLLCMLFRGALKHGLLSKQQPRRGPCCLVPTDLFRVDDGAEGQTPPPHIALCHLQWQKAATASCLIRGFIRS